MSNPRFAYDNNRHEYIDTERGEILPHITGMLLQTGWTNDKWYTSAARDRGTAVHRLTTDYDLGAIDNVTDLTSKFKPWLLAHIELRGLVNPVFTSIEEALIHEHWRYGGRPDRVGFLYGAASVVDIKSGPLEPAHAIQTALQAILVGPELRIPPESLMRYGWYLTGKGKGKLEEFKDRRDFDRAYEIIRTCCEVAA